MPSRKVERIASDLDDIAIEIDELREESAPADAERLEEVKNAIDRAGDVLDEITESHD
jgi:peptidoglycan/xylan/chitin deacetylase (PgdA/CDA1 family)